MGLYEKRARLPDPVKRLLHRAACVAVFSDRGSASRYLAARASENATTEAVGLVPLRVRALGNREVFIRPATTDARVLFATFVHRFHLPSAELVPKDAALLFDLGCNIGLTTAHLASVFDKATVVGVELDSENVSVSRKNTGEWGGRCEILEGAVWYEDGSVEYEKVPGEEDGFCVSAGAAPGVRMVKAPAFSMNHLLETYASDRVVDFAKIDIEGAERDVLRENTDWAERIRCLKIELHQGYDAEACMTDLKRLGYRAWVDKKHHACVVGLRDD